MLVSRFTVPIAPQAGQFGGGVAAMELSGTAK
jgi:hypothetical protein